MCSQGLFQIPSKILKFLSFFAPAWADSGRFGPFRAAFGPLSGGFGPFGHSIIVIDKSRLEFRHLRR
jgi:hypothetical protein